MKEWVEPEVRSDLPPPPARPKRKQRPPKPSPWVKFLRNRKPGESFQTDYTSACSVRGYCNQLNIEYRAENDRLAMWPDSGWLVRIWIIATPFNK